MIEWRLGLGLGLGTRVVGKRTNERTNGYIIQGCFYGTCWVLLYIAIISKKLPPYCISYYNIVMLNYHTISCSSENRKNQIE